MDNTSPALGVNSSPCVQRDTSTTSNARPSLCTIGEWDALTDPIRVTSVSSLWYYIIETLRDYLPNNSIPFKDSVCSYRPTYSNIKISLQQNSWIVTTPSLPLFCIYSYTLTLVATTTSIRCMENQILVLITLIFYWQ